LEDKKIFNYVGGKSHISDWIIKEMNSLCRNTNFKWKHYAEPFSGAFWVYWKLPMERIRTFKTIAYNDFNLELVNTITCLRDDRINLINAPEKIVKKYKLNNINGRLILEDEENYNTIRDTFFEEYRNGEDPPIGETILPQPERVIMFAYLHHYSFIGSILSPKMKMVKGKVAPKDKTKDIPIVKKAKNPEFFERAKFVTDINRMDCEELIKKYDSPDMFFYIDPPYWETEHYYTESVEGFGPDKHESLANTIKTMKGKFALSYYSFNELTQWFPFDEYRWERKEFTSMMQLMEGGKREEVLILNDKGEEGLLGY
jgi:site-specific DNA-adenine methylase